MTAPAQPNRGSQQPQEQRSAPDANTFAAAVANGIDNKFIEWAKDFGRSISKSVTTSQIRNIYGTVKKLEMTSGLDLPAVLLLKPRIAYASQRNKLDILANVITRAIDAVNDGKTNDEKQERFQRFCKGFEAILAYHRAAGGK